ncbi:MAG: hypothetical protein DRN53_00870 [Thermoprotei archaeon]|nr:MAG: hypothetical protein DRN53_00870 [Thermoprotei archaeon]
MKSKSLELKKAPLVSVVIVNYNDEEHIVKCLNSVFKSQYPLFEVIFIDNGSTDQSVKLIQKLYKDKLNDCSLRVFLNKINLGPAKARNIAAKHAKGKYLAFLDSDTEVDPLWLYEAIKIMESDSSIGAVQCKLLLMYDKKRYDYAGDYLTPFGFLVQRVSTGQLDYGSLDKIEEIFGAKSAGMIVKANVFFQVGMFDEDYFIYCEDTDLCWRIWLSGYRVVFVPSSIVYHDFRLNTRSKLSRPKNLDKYHGAKNYISSLIKNLETTNLIRILPVHLTLWLGLCIWYILNKRINYTVSIIKGILYVLNNLNKIFYKRIFIQKYVRKIPDNLIMKKVSRKVSLKYFICKTLSGGWST